ncbi:hypothetical protein NE236_28195 [Actinoallomurus purpureus]|uniref:hypothetical protein n=1 Tax=Actinoallomurus purpureus TaxID=478114 RepID=UPI002093A7AB|nr:hypothetical protein [Actinoallomurus purpureus]MCO6008863.1 hypothetical protein [Actinoallomurus purpureus]
MPDETDALVEFHRGAAMLDEDRFDAAVEVLRASAEGGDADTTSILRRLLCLDAHCRRGRPCSIRSRPSGSR